MGEIIQTLSISNLGKSPLFNWLRIEINQPTNSTQQQTVHIHYNDIRIELSVDDFIEFSKTLNNAASKLLS